LFLNIENFFGKFSGGETAQKPQKFAEENERGEMSILTANGVELYYELHGPEDGEVLVLSNGILMSTASWGGQKAALARRQRLLLYDCRGMWKSAHPAGPYTMELHADDLAALLDGLGIERAHIGGISYGGEVSMAFALKYPQRVRSLVLSSTVSESDVVLRGMVGTWRLAVAAKNAEMFFQSSYWMNFSAEWIEANQAVLAATALRYRDLDYEALLELIDCFLGFNITARLAEIKAPALVMVGEQDILKGRRFADVIAGCIRGAELAVVPGAGHALCIEKADVFNSLVAGFIGKYSGIEN
jgi:3-oxoadipate enol-lactonase